MIPAGSLYGSGNLTVFGEDDDWSQSLLTGNPSDQTFDGSVDAYYVFTYKRVADLPGETPPRPATAVDCLGYSIERAELGHHNANADWENDSRTHYEWNATFNTYDPSWAGGLLSQYEGMSFTWPTSGISFRSTLYYARSSIFGGGVVSVTRTGDTFCTVIVLNNQTAHMATGLSSGVSTGFSCIYQAKLRCYKGVFSIMGIPVQQ